MIKNIGFSLIELMTTIAVLGVILGIGVPSFQALIRDNRSVTLTNDLIAGLYAARSEASKQRGDITLCRRNSLGTDCDSTGTDWSAGWLVRNDQGVIKVWDPVGGEPMVTGPASAVSFFRDGRANSSAQFDIQLAGCTGEGRRVVSVNSIGRVTSSRETCL